MHKRARPRREMLTSPPPAPKFLSNREGHPGHHPLPPDANGRSGGLGGRPGNPVARVAHCAQKLGTLHHWSASPGSANPPATAARRAGAPSHPFGVGTTPNPRTVEPSAGGFAPATAATPFDRHAADFRRDLAPIRSTGGLTFAEALARDSNGGAPDPNPTQPSRAFKPREPTTTDDEGRPRGAGIGTPRRSPVLACRSLSRSCPPRSRPDRSSTDRRHLPLSIPRSPPHPFRPADLSDVDALGAKRKADALDLPTPTSKFAAAPLPDGFLSTPARVSAPSTAPPASAPPASAPTWTRSRRRCPGAFSPLQRAPRRYSRRRRTNTAFHA